MTDVRKEKSALATLSVLSNSALIVAKVAVGMITCSVSILSEAAHSGLDLLASCITFASIRISGKPPDKSHPFGHGKYENLSSFVQALLIVGTVAYIWYASVLKLVHGAQVESIHMGLAVMLLSVVINLVVSTLLMRGAKKHDSIALEADAWHLRIDVYTSLGVMAGFGAMQLTEWHTLDPIIAILVTFIIARAAVDLIRRSLAGLTDQSLPEGEEAAIKSILEEHYKSYVDFHRLKTRKSGSERHVVLHVTLHRSTPLDKAHEISHHIEKHIREKFPMTTVTIHAEPCHGKCETCQKRVPTGNCNGKDFLPESQG